MHTDALALLQVGGDEYEAGPYLVSEPRGRWARGAMECDVPCSRERSVLAYLRDPRNYDARGYLLGAGRRRFAACLA